MTLRPTTITLTFTLLATLLPLTAAAQQSTAAKAALATLMQAALFEDSQVGYSGTTPPVVVAFGRLLRDKDADAAFKRLLARGTLAGRLYALCGLYFIDPVSFRKAIPTYERMATKIKLRVGCSTEVTTVAELVRDPRALRLSPGQTVEQWTAAHNEQARRGFHGDISGGYYSSMFRTATR